MPGAMFPVGSNRQKHSLVLGVVLVALAVTAGWWALTRGTSKVDPEVERAVRPAIDAKLEEGPWRGALTAQRLDARWFCTQRLIEVRREGDLLHVGLKAHCGEYAREGDELLSGSGESTPKVVTLNGRMEVVAVQTPRDGAGYTPSLRRMFSSEGYERVRGATLPDPAVEARQALGLPPDAPLRHW